MEQGSEWSSGGAAWETLPLSVDRRSLSRPLAEDEESCSAGGGGGWPSCRVAVRASSREAGDRRVDLETSAQEGGDRRLGLEGVTLVRWCAAVFLVGVAATCLAMHLWPSGPQAAGAGLAEEEAETAQGRVLRELQGHVDHLRQLAERREHSGPGDGGGDASSASEEEWKLLQALQVQLSELQGLEGLDGNGSAEAPEEDRALGAPSASKPCERSMLMDPLVDQEWVADPSSTTDGTTCPPCPEPPATTTATEAPECPACPCARVDSPPPEKSSWAFVMMAHDEPGSHEHLVGVLAMARALQRLSAFPLLVLSNATEFPDGTQVKEAFASLHAEVLPVYPIQMPDRQKEGLMFRHWEIAWWKLQIWSLTEYEKLIWLDSDAILFRSIDWLFDRPWMWAQRDDWFCDLNVPKVCSGIVLLYPDEADYVGLLNYAAEVEDLSDGGDQKLISLYFKDVRHKPINLLDDLEASFGHCLGKTPSPYMNPDASEVRGIWSTPAFVHKSGGYQNTNDHYSNMCFSYRLEHQLFTVGDENLNMCHFHPLGAWWRMLFCEAVARIGLSMPDITSFCSDECWYQGKTPEYEGAQKCGPISTTINYDDYVRKEAAQPFEAS